MPIDQQLENLEVSENKPEQPKLIETPNNQIIQLLRGYVRSVVNMHNENYRRTSNRNGDCCSYAPIEKYLPWFRFQKNLLPSFVPLTKPELINLVSDLDVDLGYLLKETDFSALLLNTTHIDIPSGEYNELELLLQKDKISHFVKDVGPNFFSIPNYEFLSLFINEGDKFRRCAELSNWESDKYLALSEFEIPLRKVVLHFFKMPSKTELKNFCEQTGVKEIKEMYCDLVELFEFISNYNGTPDTDIVKSNLFDRLSKYHPELILTEA